MGYKYLSQLIHPVLVPAYVSSQAAFTQLTIADQYQAAPNFAILQGDRL
jgi:hypothetical protein